MPQMCPASPSTLIGTIADKSAILSFVIVINDLPNKQDRTHNNFLTHQSHLRSHWNDHSAGPVGYSDNFCTGIGHHCTAGRLEEKGNIQSVNLNDPNQTIQIHYQY